MISRSTLAVLAALVLGCGEAGSNESESATDAEADTGSDSDTGEALGDQCANTAFTLDAPDTLEATLRHANSDDLEIGASCGISGPVIFVQVRIAGRVDLHIRARGRGFEPRVAVLPPGCVSEVEDPGRALVCGDQLPVTISDLGPDAQLLIAVGASSEDPALDAPWDPDGPDGDPLDLILALEVTGVLSEDELCGPSFGRCEAGTVCPSNEGEQPRCLRPPADSCVAPGERELPPPGDTLAFLIPAGEVHSDAHEHSCAGWRRPERVDRLVLPAGLPDGVHLEVSVDDPGVGLALRRESCLLEDALACAAPSPTGSTSMIWGAPGELAALAELSQGPLLFIELPAKEEGAPNPPLSVVAEIVLD